MIGCADLIRGYPDEHTALLGLLLVAEPYQRRGSAHSHTDRRYIRGWGPDWKRVRIGVVRTNEEVLTFWTKLGFVATGEVKPYRYSNMSSETVVLEKPLRAP